MTRRPLDLDYRASVLARLGSRPALLNMAVLGSPGDERKPYQVAERVALIHVAGLLTNDAQWGDETDYRDIQSEVRQASADPDVDGILLLVNSPGGETENAFETAAVVSEAGRQKPLWAVADTMAYSAAYLLASQASQIYVPPMTGGVGSVGVYCAHFDVSEFLKKSGVKVTLISAGEGKTDGNPYEPLSNSAKQRLAGEVERLYAMFVANVARGRKLSEDAVRKLGAYCYEGPQASLAAGLADAAGTADEAWMRLALARGKPEMTLSTAASAVTSTREVGTMSDMKHPEGAQPPDADKLLAEARLQGRADAVEIVDLCQIAGKTTLAAKFLAEGKTAAQVREALLNQQADAAGPEIAGHSMPTTGTKVGLDAASNPLIAACEKVAAQMAAMGGR